METCRTTRLSNAMREHCGDAPQWAVIAGSGLGAIRDALDDPQSVGYAMLDGMPTPGVAGHAGNLIFGSIGSARAAIFCGRCHYYETGSLNEVLLVVRALGQWGCEKILLTNAAGGLNPQYRPGDLMLLGDHLNLMPQRDCLYSSGNLLQTPIYDFDLRATAKAVALREAIALHDGVYAANIGPSFETPAEAKMLRTLGADAVGMSTAPEAIAAREAGMRVLAFSYIANSLVHKAAGKTTHEEVLANSTLAIEKLVRMIREIIGSDE